MYVIYQMFDRNTKKRVIVMKSHIETKSYTKQKIICLSCIHKKTDYEGDIYCEIVNQIPKEIKEGLTLKCSFYNKENT